MDFKKRLGWIERHSTSSIRENNQAEFTALMHASTKSFNVRRAAEVCYGTCWTTLLFPRLQAMAILQHQVDKHRRIHTEREIAPRILQGVGGKCRYKGFGNQYNVEHSEGCASTVGKESNSNKAGDSQEL